MKVNIHPTYFSEAQVVCSCGNMFKTGSTKEQMHIDVCFKCHPLYTGEKRYVDTLGQVGKFQKKQALAKDLKQNYVSKKERRADKKQNAPKSLKELMMEE